MEAEDYREIPAPRIAEGGRQEKVNDFSFLR